MAEGKPTPRVSVDRELLGNNLDYLDYDTGIWHQTKSAFLRAIKPINPFSVHHDSTDDHVGR